MRDLLQYKAFLILSRIQAIKKHRGSMQRSKTSYLALSLSLLSHTGTVWSRVIDEVSQKYQVLLPYMAGTFRL